MKILETTHGNILIDASEPVKTYRLSTEVIPYTEDGRHELEVDRFEALDEYGETIARLRLEKNGLCYGIWVAPQHRRKGIATRLWECAEVFGYNPTHTAERTDDGEAWASSLGVDLPTRITV